MLIYYFYCYLQIYDGLIQFYCLSSYSYCPAVEPSDRIIIGYLITYEEVGFNLKSEESIKYNFCSSGKMRRKIYLAYLEIVISYLISYSTQDFCSVLVS